MRLAPRSRTWTILPEVSMATTSLATLTSRFRLAARLSGVWTSNSSRSGMSPPMW